MPLKTNVGVSRKVADNNYGSRGASVNLEVELDSTLIDDPERFHDRIRQVFRLAQQAIDEELTRQQQAGNVETNGHASANGNGHHNGDGNGHSAPRRSGGRRATASQARALRAIADRQGLDLAAELQGRFGVHEPEELSITEASQTIDELKASANGSSKGRR
jgi:post-segregation antitoxin (ccd killing protein)